MEPRLSGFPLELCALCVSLPRIMANRQDSSPVLWGFHNMAQIIDSATEGCHLCMLIMKEIGPTSQEHFLQALRSSPSKEQFVMTFWRYDRPDKSGVHLKPILRLESAEPEPGSSSLSTVCEFRFGLLKDLPEFGRLIRKAQPSTGSWQTLNDIHHWLGQCEFQHFRCHTRRKNVPDGSPTRLLYVEAFGVDPLIYLRQSVDIANEPSYATLSHCWGSNMSVKLEKAKVKEFCEGIAIKSLPQTFRDAVSVTRGLGLHYLWIDSLCIVQDSDEDWNTECTRMSQVYAGSFVNIAANASANSEGGLFRTRSWKSVTPVAMRLSYPPLAWDDEMAVLYPNGSGTFHRGPLMRRAWVTQERMLAPRTIHFCEHKVVWECTELFASESDVTGSVENYNAPHILSSLAVPSSTYDAAEGIDRPYVKPILMRKANEGGPISAGGEDFFPLLVSLIIPRAKPGQQDDQKGIFLYKWSQIVGTYTHCELSFAKDKLIAISGIARYIQRTLWTGDPIEYYAGLWSHQFIFQLTWHSMSKTHRVSNRAPSWSWASLDGEVMFPKYSDHTSYKPQAELMMVKLDYFQDSFGAVKSGFARMRGPLCRAVVISPEKDGNEFGQKDAKALKLLGSGHTVDCDEVIFDDLKETRNLSIGQGKLCLVLLLLMQEEDERNSPSSGLILKLTQVQPPRRGEYQRIGYFKMDNVNVEKENELGRLFHSNTPIQPRNDHHLLLKEFSAMDLPDAFYHGRRKDLYEFTVV